MAAKPNLAAMTFHADEARGRLRDSSEGPLQNARRLQSLGATDECRQPRHVSQSIQHTSFEALHDLLRDLYRRTQTHQSSHIVELVCTTIW